MRTTHPIRHHQSFRAPFGHGLLLICLLWWLAISLAWAADPFRVETMHQLLRASDAQLSPDGKWVAFTVAHSNLGTNKMVRNLWLVSTSGGDARALTFAGTGSNERPRWSPDSRSIYFLSSRVENTAQVFKLDLSGGEAVQVTHSPVEVDSFILSPDGKTLVLTASVFPDSQGLAASKKLQKEKEESPVKARLLTEVPFRRWDSWVDGKRNHLFCVPVAGGEPKDLTPGDIDSPIWTEDGTEEIAFSPDSQELCFSRYTESEGFVGNSDLFTLPLTGGQPTQITTNRSADSTPLYSPDGRYIAYKATLRPDLESDQPRLFVYDRKTRQHINLTEQLDRPIQSYLWNPDSRSLWITIEDQGLTPILRLDLATKAATRLPGGGTCGDVQVSADGKLLTFTRSDFSDPTDLFRLDTADGSSPTPLTHLNADILKQIEFGTVRPFSLSGWHSEPVQCWEIRPPGFKASQKYPLLLLMHGGPEGSWHNLFHYRWNAHLFAARGYVVIMPNFHGSTGFGLKFMDAIKGQWGGAPYEDQMKAVDEALTWSYIDPTRLAAAGASYGGYMANWVAGHTDRFRTIVNHDGLYDLVTALYSADFPGGVDKEFYGAPWTNQQALIEQAPSTYAKNFKTPMLIIHGEKDYRVDPSNGFATFQVLQAMKIPSKLLYFPDENHWVLKPANSVLWYHTVLDWLDRWVQPTPEEYARLKTTWPCK
jgi:dipeptidyl aminopeptidase/acylaminoacyl peptidase